MRFSKPPGIFPDKLIGYWIEHRTSRTSGSCGSCGSNRASSIEHRASSIEHRTSNIEHRTGSRCLFKLFCLFACLFSFDKHRSGSRGPRSRRFGALPKRQWAACLTVNHWKQKRRPLGPPIVAMNGFLFKAFGAFGPLVFGYFVCVIITEHRNATTRLPVVV